VTKSAKGGVQLTSRRPQTATLQRLDRLDEVQMAGLEG
jgi:hypothetical protein